jgi:hypothetical protein
MPDLATLASVWDDADLALKGLARAMYREGRFTQVSGTTATVVFPNSVHRDKCESRRSEVERALSSRFGVDVKLELLAEGESGGPAQRPVPDPEPEPDADVPLAIAEVHELPDAPSAATGGIDALTEAFPGAEFVE